MHIILFLVNLILLLFIIYSKKKTKIKSTIGKKILYGFGIFCTIGSFFCTIGSLVDNEIYEISMSYSIFAIVLYLIYIVKSGLLPFSGKILKNVKKNNNYTTIDGILVDDNDNESIIIYRPLGSYMSIEDTKLIDKHELPKINTNNLLLKANEYCCFMDIAITQKSKTVTKGYERTSNSVRVFGTSWRTGTGTSKAIRQEEITSFSGKIYITNKRIIYVSQGSGDSFDKEIDKITAIEEAQDGVIIQIGSKTHLIILNTHVLFMQVLNLVKNKEYGVPLPEVAFNEHVKYTIDSNILKLQNK